jgi:ABC-type nitrate/sulfonate/bicarbonate transport system permease component
MSRITKRALIGIEIVVPIVVFGAWWLLSANTTSAFFPPLGTIVEHFQQLWLWDKFASDILPSLANLVVGYSLSVVIGVSLGVVFGSSRILAWVVEPLITFWRAIPPVALVPIFISLFGYGNETRIFSITLAALFPTLLATIDGMRGVDPILTDVGRTFSIPTLSQLFSLRLRAASPMVFAGMQVGLQFAFVVMIASEMMGVSVGIGAVTLQSQQTFRAADMWAGILLLGIIGYLTNLVFEWIRRRALAWYFASQKVS